MRELSLFTGGGGGVLGTHMLGWTPVGYVEIDDYAQRIIRARIDDGILPAAPIFGDIRSFNRDGYAAAYQGMVDVVTAGFPCQPFSIAGKQLGADDDRNMWPETIAAIRLVRPRYCLLENVPGLLTSGYFGTVLGDLAQSGYDARWRVLSAAEVGAPHKRDRLWIVAYNDRCRPAWARANGAFANTRADGRHNAGGLGASLDNAIGDGWHEGRNVGGEHERRVAGAAGQHAGDVADAESITERKPADETDAVATGGNARHESGDGCQLPDPERQSLAFGERPPGERPHPAIARGDWWAVEPDVGGIVDGLARWLDISGTS